MTPTVILQFLAGLALGAVVGAVAQLTTFCSVGAVADIILAKDWRRARSWLMAGTVALLGTQSTAAMGLVPLDRTFYTPSLIGVIPVGIGSIAFGYGMALAGGCLQRALVRIGGGSVKSLVTVAIMAVTGVMAFHVIEITGIWSATSIPIGTPSSLNSVAAAALGTASGPTLIVITGALTLGLLIFCLKDGWFRASPAHLWGGVAIGAVIVLAWTGWRFVGTAGLNPLLYLVNASYGLIDRQHAPASVVFEVLVLLGIVLGAFAVALARGDLMLDRFGDRQDVKRHIIGGVLMGVGGTFAGGCTFGQGLTGFSTLSVNAMIAIAGMIAGCVWGIRALETGSAWKGLRLCFGRRG